MKLQQIPLSLRLNGARESAACLLHMLHGCVRLQPMARLSWARKTSLDILHPAVSATARTALGTPQLSSARDSLSWYHSGRPLSCQSPTGENLTTAWLDKEWPSRHKPPTWHIEHLELLPGA